MHGIRPAPQPTQTASLPGKFADTMRGTLQDWDMVKDQVVYSEQWKKMLGYENNEVEDTFSGWKNLWHPDDCQSIENALKDYLAGETNEYEIIHRLRHKNGCWRWILTRGDIVKDAQGKSIRWVGTNIDITERKHAEEKIKSLLTEKELLLKEVHHRIKNNMNTVAGIMSLQLDTLKEPTAIAAINDARSRVVSMMLLYDKIQYSNDLKDISFKEYISPLVDEIVSNYPNKAILKIEKNICDFMIDGKRSSYLGIIINELLTNVMKYAFTGRDNGLLVISASIKNNHVIINVQDNGIGISETIDITNSSGFGLQLVDMMAKQLKGMIKIERNNGTKFILEFNL